MAIANNSVSVFFVLNPVPHRIVDVDAIFLKSQPGIEVCARDQAVRDLYLSGMKTDG